ncbi:MAG TPA: hypothetical protein DCY45_04895 [Mesotoga sp.]|nr:hypothetical protein [Mesotoga sp.]
MITAGQDNFKRAAIIFSFSILTRFMFTPMISNAYQFIYNIFVTKYEAKPRLEDGGQRFEEQRTRWKLRASDTFARRPW